MNNKRGLSAVITSLMMILLVLVAVGIVWVVVKNVISEGTEGVSIEQFSVDLEIKNVKVSNGNLSVTVKRNPGRGEVNSLKFVLSDGTNSEVVELKNIDLDELEENTYNVDYNINLVKKISVSPTTQGSSGNEVIGSVSGVVELQDKEVAKSFDGLVSWWRFEEVIANITPDETGINDGLVQNGLDCNAQGKYGKACSFDGYDDYVTAPVTELPQNGPATISGWFNPIDNATDRGNMINWYGGIIYQHPANNGLYFLVGSSLFITFKPSINTWQHVLITYNGDSSTGKLYVNGDWYEDITPQTSGDIDPFPGKIGDSVNSFNGSIDEVMIFNKVLNQTEITALYNLDLS